MKTLYGALIMFFYFVKYPVVIFYLINFFYFGVFIPHYFDIFTFICVVLIGKDFFFPHNKPDNCSEIKE